VVLIPENESSFAYQELFVTKGRLENVHVKRLSKKPINSYIKALEKESEARFASGIDTDTGAEESVTLKKSRATS